MINILESKTHRNIKLIDVLFSQNAKLSISELSAYFHVSDSTIFNDINYLNETYSDYLFINKSQPKQIKIEQTSSSNVNYVQYLILNHSKNIQLLTELLLNPFKRIKDYSACLNLSSSYIYKAIDQINISLSPFNIVIKGINNKYFIDATSEVLLRKLFTVFLVETKSYMLDEIFDQQNELQKFKKGMTSDFFLNMNVFQIYFFTFFYLSIVREKQFFNVTDTLISSTQKEVTETNLTTQIIIESLTYSPFANNHYFYNRNFYRLEEYLLTLSNQDQDKVHILFQLITKIYENEISYQIPPSLFLNKLNSFYYGLKDKKHLYGPVKKIINDISAIIHIDLKEYEIILSYILMIHFSELLSFNHPRSIFIFSKLSLYHAEFLRSYFISKFETYYDFIIVRDKEIFEISNDSAIFLTNDPDLPFKNKVIINDYPTKTDIQHFKEQISLLLH